MKHLEVLIVAASDPAYDEARSVFEAEGWNVSVRHTMKEALSLMLDQGLGFDVMLVDAGHDLWALDDLAHHRETANMPVVCVFGAGQSRQLPFECDGTVDLPTTRRALIDAVHHALNRHGRL